MVINLQNNSIWGIPPYTFWAGIGLACSIIMFFYLLYDSKRIIDKQLFVFIWGIVGVLLGAKLFGCIKNLLVALYYDRPLTAEIIGSSGLVYYGGLTGFLLCSSGAILVFYKKMDAGLINLLAIVIPLFHGFGRIGCLFAGCCFGMEYTGPFSVTYMSLSGEFRSCFPVQIVESFGEWLVFLILFAIYKTSRSMCRNLMKIYLIIYAVLRFILEFVRGDTIRGIFGIFSFSQYISLGIMIIFVLFQTASIIGKNKEIKK